MKYLRIENKEGQYYDGEKYRPINEIGKKDLLYLLDSAERVDFQIDSYDQELLPDPSHRIIYKNITEKFEQFLENKNQFKERSEKMYASAIAKYTADFPEESASTIFADEDDLLNPEDIPF